MKWFKRIITVLLVLMVIGLLVLVFHVHNISNRPVPKYHQDIQLERLGEEVEVYMDSLAIPHVYAKSDSDLYRVVGYVTARERLWQMDLLRRVTQGRLSEIFGNSFIDTDYLLKSLRYQKKSEKIWEERNQQLETALSSFADGVNQYIEKNKGAYPVEFSILGYKPEKWEPVHSINLIGYMAWDLKAGWSQLLLEDIKNQLDSAYYNELLPDPKLQNTYVYPGFKPESSENSIITAMIDPLRKLEPLGVSAFSASNNWAVNGKLSTSGKPLLANDMHLGLNVPGIWYQMHQVIEDELNVTGLVLPGQPLVIAGHNEKIAWGMTNVYVDNMDFYEETVNPANRNQYLLDSAWQDFDVDTFVIRLKSGDTIIKTNRYTHRGPVISGMKGFEEKIVSMQWIGDLYSNEIRSIYLLNRAGNWNEFKDAMRTFISISQNINYADTRGNIGLYCCAGVPVRNRNYDGMLLPGHTTKFDWIGLVPFDELPHSYNPASGFVSSANNRTVSKSYPYHIGTWYSLPHRMDRINEMITARDKHSVESFREIQNDYKSKLVENMLPGIIEILGGMELVNSENVALELLRDWNGEMDPNTPQPLIFEVFYQHFIKNLFKDEMGEALFEKYIKSTSLPKFAVKNVWLNDSSAWIDDITTIEKETMNDMVYMSFAETLGELEDHYGNKKKNKWKWGDFHTLTLEHPLSKKEILDKVFQLNSETYPVGGSYHTVCPYSYTFGGDYSVNHGASHRHIFDLSNWDNSITVIPTGNSGIPAGDFYLNQTEMYINQQYHRDLFSKPAVVKNARYKSSFKPVGD
jgi:penicillin amidase